MRAGRLRHRVELLQVTDTKGAGGKITQTETALATVWAEVVPLQGREFFSAQQVQSEITTKITIRYYPGLTAKHRVRFDSRTFDIRSATNWQERKQFIELLCVERRV